MNFQMLKAWLKGKPPKMDEGIASLREAAIKLGCSLATTARASMIYHHFVMSIAGEGDYDLQMLAAVALGISGTSHKESLDIDSLINVFYCMVNKTSEVLFEEDAAYRVLKKSFTHMDFLMRRMLEFNINYSLAYQYLSPFLHMIFERSAPISEFRQELSSTCVRFISDFYTTKICLTYAAEHIAIACIDLGLRVHGFLELTFINPPWYQGFCNDLTVEHVEKIRHDILQLYENET